MPKATKKNPIISPTQERSQQTFEAIVKATTYLIEARGLNHFTTNEIAEKAGVNINSFYQYFFNKDAAILEVTNRLMKGDEDFFALSLEKSANLKSEEALKQILVHMNQLMSRNKVLRKNILVNLGSIIGSDKLHRRRRLFAQSLVPFIPKDKFPTEDDRFLASQVIVHTFLSVTVGFMDGALRETEKEKIQSEIMKLIMNYVIR